MVLLLLLFLLLSALVAVQMDEVYAIGLVRHRQGVDNEMSRGARGRLEREGRRGMEMGEERQIVSLMNLFLLTQQMVSQQ